MAQAPRHLLKGTKVLWRFRGTKEWNESSITGGHEAGDCWYYELEGQVFRIREDALEIKPMKP